MVPSQCLSVGVEGSTVDLHHKEAVEQKVHASYTVDADLSLDMESSCCEEQSCDHLNRGFSASGHEAQSFPGLPISVSVQPVEQKRQNRVPTPNGTLNHHYRFMHRTTTERV